MKQTIDDKVRKEILERVKQEFPGCRALQDLHYYRYVKEIEWQAMSPADIVRDIRKDAQEIEKDETSSETGFMIP